jgi:hypothetical protein
MTQLPQPPTRPPAVAVLELDQAQVRFLQKERRARRGAAAADKGALQHRYTDIRLCEGLRHEGTGHASTDDDDVCPVTSSERRISQLEGSRIVKPNRSSESQMLSCVAHRGQSQEETAL